MATDLKRLSKFLAVVLRHSPEDFGIQLDEQGYAPLTEVWGLIKNRYEGDYTEDDLSIVVDGDQRGKKRYEIVGNQIRALYGHSKPRVIYSVVEPPKFLYHGTNTKAFQSIREEGLKSLKRQYVHLTTNRDNALVVAKRQTKNPMILIVRALDAHQAGIVFHQPETEHYLAATIPIDFIEIEE